MTNVNFSTSPNFTQNDSAERDAQIVHAFHDTTQGLFDSNSKTGRQTTDSISAKKNNILTAEELNQFRGTSNYFNHFICGDNFVYTDGVRYMARTGRCYWLIDEIAFLLPWLLKKCPSRFYCILVSVNEDRSAEIVINDGNENVITKRKIARTDLQIESGELTLYLAVYNHNENGAPKYCLMLSSEY